MFYCKFDYAKLSVAVHDFYKECILLWSSLNNNNLLTLDDIVNQVLWNNKFICIGNKSAYNKRIIDHGLYKVGDLYDCVGELKITKEPLRPALSPVDIFFLFSMVNALPQAWWNLLNTNTNKTSITLTTHPLIYDQYRLHFENEEFNLEKLQSKALCNKFISKISTMPTATKLYENLFNSEKNIFFPF